MSLYLFAVQTDTGHEVLSWRGEPAKVSDVVAVRQGDVVLLQHDGETVARTAPVDPDVVLQLHRWDAEDKLGKPVSKPVRKAEDQQ